MLAYAELVSRAEVVSKSKTDNIKEESISHLSLEYTLEVHKRCMDVAFRDVVYRLTCTVKWMVGLRLKPLFQSKWFYSILWRKAPVSKWGKHYSDHFFLLATLPKAGGLKLLFTVPFNPGHFMISVCFFALVTEMARGIKRHHLH